MLKLNVDLVEFENGSWFSSPTLGVKVCYGTESAKSEWRKGSEVEIDLDCAFTLLPGRNVVSVHLRQKESGDVNELGVAYLLLTKFEANKKHKKNFSVYRKGKDIGSVRLLFTLDYSKSGQNPSSHLVQIPYDNNCLKNPSYVDYAQRVQPNYAELPQNQLNEVIYQEWIYDSANDNNFGSNNNNNCQGNYGNGNISMNGQQPFNYNQPMYPNQQQQMPLGVQPQMYTQMPLGVQPQMYPQMQQQMPIQPQPQQEEPKEKEYKRRLREKKEGKKDKDEMKEKRRKRRNLIDAIRSLDSSSSF